MKKEKRKKRRNLKKPLHQDISPQSPPRHYDDQTVTATKKANTQKRKKEKEK